VFIKHFGDNNFDKKESLLGFYGTTEPPQKALAIVDFVMHTTKLDTDLKTLL